MEALNMTAIVGDKGSEHPHQCLNNTDGSNVLSVTFLPEHQTLVGQLAGHGSVMCDIYPSIQHGRSLQGTSGDQLCELFLSPSLTTPS